MNQVMPEWRALSSDPSAPPDGEGSSADAPGARLEVHRAPRSRVAVAAVALTVLGGTLLGAALVGLAAMLLLAPAAGTTIDVGTPLTESTATETVRIGERGVETATGELIVDVAGAVVRPGLHRLAAGARVGDAIEAAGGYAPSADLAAASVSLNLAAPLQDGSKVLVPPLGVAEVVPMRGTDGGRIDLNRAGRSELETLPGVGPVTAGKIVEARAQRRFTTVRELRTRGIVGQAVFDDIKELVSVGA